MENLTNLNVRVNADDKKNLTELMDGLGLNVSTYINIAIKKALEVGGIPFEVTTPKPSRRLKKALKELDYMENHLDEYKSYDNVDELFEDLNSED